MPKKEYPLALDFASVRSEWVIREKPEIFPNYDSLLVPYIERLDLTNEEKVEIGNYQDVWPYNLQKTDWSIPIPPDWTQKSWCYVINSCCRSAEFYNSLTDIEKETVCNSVRHIESAVQKSSISRKRMAYRGVYDLRWFTSDNVGDEFIENAFGSFSLKMEHALRYTNFEKPIIFRLDLNSRMKALYVDHAEYEVLRPRHSAYTIQDIFSKFSSLYPDKEITIYSIKEILE